MDEWIVSSVFIAVVGVVLILIIWNIVLSVKMKRQRSMLQEWMGDTQLIAFHQVMEKIQQDQQNIQLEQQNMQTAMRQMADQLKKLKGHIGVHRYNAFLEQGHDLSYSIAILDEQQDGVVITGIRIRDESYTYAKPVNKGQSTYPLSPEEVEAINRAKA